MPKKNFIIEECPRAFLEFAKKHNGLASQVGMMEGKRGVKVTISDVNIIVESAGGQTYAVGPYGKLLPVPLFYPPDYVDGLPAYYPQLLRTDNGGKTVTADSTGLVVSDGTYNATIDFATLTSKMVSLSLREIDVCDSGVAKKMLILASAPY